MNINQLLKEHGLVTFDYGDMYAETYDTDGDGTVDSADNAHQLGGVSADGYVKKSENDVVVGSSTPTNNEPMWYKVIG